MLPASSDLPLFTHWFAVVQMKSATSVEGRRQLAAPPPSVQCLACRGQYFSASLPIHQKSCFQRNGFALIPCSKCKTAVQASSYHDHAASCSGDKCPTQGGHSAKHLDERTTAGRCVPMDVNPPEEDGRVRCKTCERAFSQDRIMKHQSVCHGKPRAASSGLQDPRRRALVSVERKGVARVPAPLRRRSVLSKTVLAPRALQASFDLPEFLGERYRAEAYCPSGVRRSSAARHTGGSTRFDGSGCYPGAQAMTGGGWETSNASSASNPLVTNALMTVPR